MAKKPRENGDAGASEATSTTQTINIQGVTFTAPAPYAEGHPLTRAEAVTLNQTYGENLRNNFAKRVKQAKDAAGGELPADQIEGLRQEFAQYAENYQFHGKRTSRVVDPVEKEASKMAKTAILERLRSQGKDAKSLSSEKMDELITQLLDRNPKFRAEAQRRVDASKEYSGIEFDLEV